MNSFAKKIDSKNLEFHRVELLKYEQKIYTKMKFKFLLRINQPK
jgi:hypothetical protein